MKNILRLRTTLIHEKLKLIFINKIKLFVNTFQFRIRNEKINYLAKLGFDIFVNRISHLMIDSILNHISLLMYKSKSHLENLFFFFLGYEVLFW
jgi:hypothetical protein